VDERSNKSLARSLYERYILVVVILLALVGGIQVQSLHSSLVLGGEGSLVFAYRDSLAQPQLRTLSSERELAQKKSAILAALSAHGVNVRLYNRQLQAIGSSTSYYAPVALIPITQAIAAQAVQYRMMPIHTQMRAFVLQEQGQILLFAALGPPKRIIGYAELGYRESILYPIIAQQGLMFFAFSLLVVILAAALLLPLVGAPLQPLRRLTEVAMRIRSGAFAERLPSVGTVETIRLAEVVNDVLDKLAEAVDREQMSAQRMKEFISAASHELRTPLTTVRGFTDVLQKRVASQPQDSKQWQEMGQALQTMQREITRLETLVRDLLQLARLDERVSLRLEQVDLAELVEQVKPQLMMLAHDRTLHFDLTSSPTRCDRAMVEQVLYNLVTNAVHYTSQERGSIRIQVAPTEQSHVQLTVQDNGEGIAKDQLERIFDRFFRASTARSRNPGGAGLGLSIVAEIVRAHDGDIHVDSELGQGTTMTIVW